MVEALLRACADWLEHRHQIRLFPVRERDCWSRSVSSELLPINFLTIHCFRVITGDDPAVSTDQTGSPSPRSPFAALSWLQQSLNGKRSSGCSAAAIKAGPSIREAAIPETAVAAKRLHVLGQDHDRVGSGNSWSPSRVPPSCGEPFRSVAAGTISAPNEPPSIRSRGSPPRGRKIGSLRLSKR
jgi:hypothetical protein